MPAALSTDSGSYVLGEKEASHLHNAETATELVSLPVTKITACAHTAGRYFLATLEKAGTVFVSLIFAPAIIMAWLAVGLHYLKSRDSIQAASQEASEQQAWMTEMEDFDRF